MPRKKINVKKRILENLNKYGKLTWTRLLEKTKVSKGSLSKYLNKPQMEELVERIVDATTKPPTVYYRLKELNMADVPEKLASDILDYTTESRFMEHVKEELKILREKGITVIEGPDKAVENMYDFWYMDFLFTLHHCSQAPNVWSAMGLLSWHIVTYKLTMWEMIVKFAKNPEWKQELERNWKELLKSIEEGLAKQNL